MTGHPDMKKIRIIGFVFENRLHWQSEGENKFLRTAVLGCLFIYVQIKHWGHAGGHGWLRHFAASRRSRVRFPMVSLEFFIDIMLAGLNMALGLTQPLTEMRNISWGVKAAGA